MVGVKRNVTGCEAPAAIVPLVRLVVNPAEPVPPTTDIDVNVSVAFPLLLIVNVRSAVDPKLTLPNARSPETVMLLVATVGVVGVLGEGEDPPQAAQGTHMPRMSVARTRFMRASCGNCGNL